VRDGSGLASSDTRCGFPTIAGLTGGATIPHLLSSFLFHTCHRTFTEDVKLIGTDLKHTPRADIYALTAPIALVGINDNEPVSGTIFKTIVGNHILPFPLTLSLSPAYRQAGARGEGK